MVIATLSGRETLDVRATCRILGVSEPTLRRAIARGAFPTVRVPGVERGLVARATVEQILRDGTPPNPSPAERQLSAA